MLKSSIALPWTALLSAAVLILSACGQKVPAPTAISMDDRYWWNIFGHKTRLNKDPLEDMLLTRGDQNVGKGYSRLLLPKKNLSRVVQLHLAIPDHTVSSGILQAYNRKTGVTFRISIFSSEAEFHQLLGKGSVDVALVPMQLAEELVQRHLLERLTHAALPHLKDLEWPKPVSQFLTRDFPIDRDNNYLVPYLFGSIGIAYDRTYLPDGVPSFKMLHHPEILNPYEFTNIIGRIALSNDPRIALAGALLSIGEDINTTNTAALERAGKELLQLRPYLYKHGGTNFAAADRLEWARRMASHEVVVAETTAGNAALAATLNHDISFSIPTEGAILVIDSFVIPLGGKKIPAHDFINFMMAPDVAGKFTGLSYYASTSHEARMFVPHNVLGGIAYTLQAEHHHERHVLRAGNWDLKKLNLEVFQ